MLVALYGADRAEAASTLSVAFALLGLAVAYVTGTLAFAELTFRQFGWLSVLVPFPLWIIAAFHSLLTTSAMVRSVSIRALERKLQAKTSFKDLPPGLIGMEASEKILNIKEAKRPHQLATGLAYGGIVLIFAFYTLYFLVRAPGLGSVGRVVAFGLYVAIAVVVWTSWRAGFEVYNRNARVLLPTSESPTRRGGMRSRVLRIIALTLAALVVLVAIDSLVGLTYRASTAVQIYVTRSNVAPINETLVVFPGYTMPGNLLSRAFAPYLAPHEAMVVVGYAERGLDVDAIYGEVMVQVKRLGGASLRVYGGSIGGLVAVQFLQRYGRDGARFGTAVLVLDTTPSSSEQVKRPRWMFRMASWYRGGPITSAGWAEVSQFLPKPELEAGANRHLAKAAWHAEAWVGTPALTTQAAYLSNFSPLRANELAPVVARAVYLRGGPGDDPLVQVDQSIHDWSRMLPGLFVTALPRREAGWHLPIIERPQETMSAINAA
jgi:hypothetical protein